MHKDTVEGSINPRAKSETAPQEIDQGLILSPNSPICQISFGKEKREREIRAHTDQKIFLKPLINIIILDQNILAPITPSLWHKNTVYTECTLHQIAPYVGKMKSTMAKQLIQRYSKPEDTILDPFVGSGTIALESLILNRGIICYDINPYGVTLTKAKIFPPKNVEIALAEAEYYLDLSKSQEKELSLENVPLWVRKFFHPETLKETISFTNIILENEKYFLLGCLLGILHHQRPGFLSYPASHSIPYLRDKKYPKDTFPKLYKYRDIKPRILNKIIRAYKRVPIINNNLTKKCEEKNVLDIDLKVNCIEGIITSPPYMDTLDYFRDNRLRLWFLGINYENKEIISNPTNIIEFTKLMTKSFKIFERILKNKKYIVIVIGDVRKSYASDLISTDEIIKNIIIKTENIHLYDVIEDKIIYVDKSRMGKVKKRECVIVARKEI